MVGEQQPYSQSTLRERLGSELLFLLRLSPCLLSLVIIPRWDLHRVWRAFWLLPHSRGPDCITNLLLLLLNDGTLQNGGQLSASYCCVEEENLQSLFGK